MYNHKLILCIFLILIFLITGCSSIQDTSLTNIQQDVEPTRQFEQGKRATGLVTLSKHLDLSFTISGNVAELLVEEGDRLHEWNVIARLDTSLIEQEIAEEEADLEVAKANLELARMGPSQAKIIEAENDLLAAQAERPKNMAQATIQVTDINSAQAHLDHLKTLPLPEEIARAQASVDRAQTRVDSTYEIQEKSVMYSPIEGTVLEVFIHVSEYAGRGDPVVRLSDLNNLSVQVLMDEIDVAGLTIGDEVTVTFEALPDDSAQAVIPQRRPCGISRSLSSTMKSRSSLLSILGEKEVITA